VLEIIVSSAPSRGAADYVVRVCACVNKMTPKVMNGFSWIFLERWDMAC